MLSYQPIFISILLVLSYVIATCWWLRLSALPQGSKIIAYASEGGSAAKLARQLQQQLALEQQQVGVLTLNQLKAKQLEQADQLFIITSTHGEGEAPENGRLIEKHLARLAADSLAHLQVAVLALGDKNYSHYCAFGTRLAERFVAQGASLLFPVIRVDNLDNSALQRWQDSLFQQGILQNKTSVEKIAALPELYSIKLLTRTLLNSHSPGRPMYELEFSIAKLPAWQAGDIATLHLGSQKREYTIASLPSENVLRLLVRQQYSEAGELGLGSKFLTQDLAIHQNACFSVRSNPNFYASSSISTPMILIGNGTGLSGLRAHLKQREQHEHTENWLIYGERNPVHDLPWQQELQHWQQNSHLQQLDLTFSRTDNCQWPKGENGSSCRCYAGYVQQVLASNSEQLKKWLSQGATIYLCGSKIGMAEDVEQQLKNILGEEYLEQLIEQERFKRDVY